MTDSRFSKLIKKLKSALPVLKISASIGLLAFAIILIGCYTLFSSRGSFHSDTTDTIMWAEAACDAGKIFNPDFAYACLLPFGTSLIMSLLIPFTGVSMTTHVLGMCIFFLLFTIAMIRMFRQMHWGWGWIAGAVFSVLMICSGSTKLREIFWGHTIYYSLGVLFIFAGLGFIFHRIDLLENLKKPEKKMLIPVILNTILIFVWMILTCSDQIIAVTIFAVPVIAAVFCERFLDRHTKLCSFQNLDSLLLVIIMSAGMCIGYLLTNYLAGDITAGYQESYSSYSDMSTWISNFLKFPTAWVSLLGAEAAENDPLMSPESIRSLLIIITGIILLILPVIALCCYSRIKDRKLRILILTYWFMTGLILLGYVVGRLSVANWRLSPIVAMSAVVSIAFLRWAVSQENLKRISVLLSLPVYIISCLHAVTIAEMPMNNTSENILYQLAEQLEDLDLSYGYATFWNANGLTIVSDSRVQCRDIEINENGFYKRYYQSNITWYEDQPEQKNYFVLMTDTEAGWVINGNSLVAQQPHKIVYLNLPDFEERYQVWIYSENIF